MRTPTSLVLVLVAGLSFTPAQAQSLSPIEELGKAIFFDNALSINQNQACAACHAPDVGWTGPDGLINAEGAVYEGSIPGRFGNRKPPSSAYATQSPVFHNQRRGKAAFVGGNFWNGRATGEKLGNPAADQAQGPFFNTVEQALPDSACVVYRVCTASYPISLQAVWGEESCAITWPPDVDAVCSTEGASVTLSQGDQETADSSYDEIALSIAAYEGSSEVNLFSSKYDLYLAGLAELTPQEQQGLRLFRGKGKCSKCHSLKRGPNGEPPLFTDFTFDNLGVPRNPDNPWYDMPPEFNPLGDNRIDLGLGGFLAMRTEYQQFAPESYGKQKVPTLRNVDLRPDPGFIKAYGHNGYFKSLKSIVHFYNTRDVKPVCPNPFTGEAEALALDCWPEPEVPANVNDKELGNLHLSDAQENAIVAFMKTLSDGF